MIINLSRNEIDDEGFEALARSVTKRPFAPFIIDFMDAPEPEYNDIDSDDDYYEEIRNNADRYHLKLVKHKREIMDELRSCIRWLVLQEAAEPLSSYVIAFIVQNIVIVHIAENTQEEAMFLDFVNKEVAAVQKIIKRRIAEDVFI